MRLIDMHDYSPAARWVWWLVVVLGTPIIAVSLWRIASLPPSLLFTALTGSAVAAVVGYFSFRIPGTKVSIAGAEIFIILMLLLFGIPGGVLAASAEGFVAAMHVSRRWTSRISTPTLHAINMLVWGTALEVLRSAADAAGMGPAGLVLSVMAFAALYFASSTFTIMWMLGLKSHAPITPLAWLRGSRLIGLWFVASGSIASLLYITFEQFGWPVLLVAVPVIAMFMSTWHALDRLAVANRHKDEFLASMSHELRTPLNCIIGGSEILKDGIVGTLTPQQAEWAGDIHESGKHLLTLINDILDLSKIEAGHMELQFGTFDVSASIAAAVTQVKERAARQEIRLVSSVDASVGSVRADERKVRQVLSNLLSNAVKFTPHGGTVTVGACRTGAGVEISVADTGVGIAKADHEAAFEAFRRVGTHAGSKVEGTGLGLTLARSLVQLHSGSIRLASEPGVGSTFTVCLPDRATLAAVAPAEVAVRRQNRASGN